MDQARALRSSGLSSRGLGPLMPVCMPPAAKQAVGSGHPAEPTAAAGAAPAPEAAAGSAVAAAGADAQGQKSGVSKAAAEAPDTAASSDKPAAVLPASAPPPSAVGAAAAPPAEGEVVWVHRQCALWSPEVYPGKTGVLVSALCVMWTTQSCCSSQHHQQ